jgi:hypothetical protein
MLINLIDQCIAVHLQDAYGKRILCRGGFLPWHILEYQTAIAHNGIGITTCPFSTATFGSGIFISITEGMVQSGWWRRWRRVGQESMFPCVYRVVGCEGYIRVLRLMMWRMMELDRGRSDAVLVVVAATAADIIAAV